MEESVKVLTVMDMRAVQHLMQLSDEDNNNNNNNKDNDKNSRKNDRDDEEVDQPRTETTTAAKKIEEIFGKEDAYRYRPKKRRYRSLVSIYTATKPMNNARYGKKVRSSTNPNSVLEGF